MIPADLQKCNGRVSITSLRTAPQSVWKCHAVQDVPLSPTLSSCGWYDAAGYRLLPYLLHRILANTFKLSAELQVSIPPRHRSSSIISDTDTLVDQSTESLLAKSPNSPDAPMMPSERDEWGFWDLMAYKPVQILSTTMFMNS
jgi:hypothetical protein